MSYNCFFIKLNVVANSVTLERLRWFYCMESITSYFNFEVIVWNIHVEVNLIKRNMVLLTEDRQHKIQDVD